MTDTPTPPAPDDLPKQTFGMGIVTGGNPPTPAPDDLVARASEMLRIAARYIRENWADGTIHYDEADCDGYCVADDCEGAAEGLSDRIEALTAEVARLKTQCEGLAQAAMNNGQALILAEAERDAAVEALRVIAGNSCITCSADAFNVLFAMKHPARIKEKRT